MKKCNVGANFVRPKINKGITLIALVITIIIMLILVAVTVSYSIKSGLLSKAKGGASKYTQKEETEKIGQIQLEYKVDKETNNTNGKELFNYLVTELSGEADISSNGGEIIVKYKKTGNEYKIKDIDNEDDEQKNKQGYAIFDDDVRLTWQQLIDGVSKDIYEYNNLYISNTAVDGEIIDMEEGMMAGAFLNCSRLKSIVIPSSVTKIGDCSFTLSSLENIDIPNNVNDIGNFAFCYCTNLTNIKIPNNVSNVGNMAFSNSALTAVNIPKNVIFGDQAFNQCANLASVNIENGTTTIWSGMFSVCSKLQTITLPDSVELIDAYAFEESAISSVIYKGKTYKSASELSEADNISIASDAFNSCVNFGD